MKMKKEFLESKYGKSLLFQYEDTCADVLQFINKSKKMPVLDETYVFDLIRKTRLLVRSAYFYFDLEKEDL